VYYCQECGAANSANAALCRICGRHLIRERGGAPCHSCGAPTVLDGKFCSLCGLAITTHSSGSHPSGPASVDQDTVVAVQSQPSAAAATAPLKLGEGLDLPDWLKRAASEQPFDPNQQAAIAANPFGPPAGATSVLTRPAKAPADATTVASPVRTADGIEVSSRPPLSIPNDAGALPAMGNSDVPTAESAVTNPSAAGPTVTSDPSDTSSFISENDLPEWIRQLAAADEAKKAEELRLAAETARAELKTAAADGRRRRLLPGETEDAGPATSPWLARRDRPESPQQIAADSWGTAASRETPAAVDRGTEAPAAVDPVPELSAETVQDLMHQQPMAAAAKTNPDTLRLILLAAAVLAIVALIAFTVVS
jgi:hypothetical protein